MAKIIIELSKKSKSRSSRQNQTEGAEEKEFPLLEELRIRQKALNPEAFSSSKIKVRK